MRGFCSRDDRVHRRAERRKCGSCCHPDLSVTVTRKHNASFIARWQVRRAESILSRTRAARAPAEPVRASWIGSRPPRRYCSPFIARRNLTVTAGSHPDYFEDLLKRAKKDGLLKPEEESDFDEFRHLRNAYAHFREPSHELSSLRRSLSELLFIARNRSGKEPAGPTTYINLWRNPRSIHEALALAKVLN